MPRFSLKSLMWFTTFVVISACILRNPTDRWLLAAPSAVAILIGVAAARAVFSSESQRIFWVSFVFGFITYCLILLVTKYRPTQPDLWASYVALPMWDLVYLKRREMNNGNEFVVFTILLQILLGIFASALTARVMQYVLRDTKRAD